MKGFSMSPAMKIAGVWVAWAFLAIGALGWALFVVLDAFEAKKDAAAWIQAIGSVLAIIGAAAFPVIHSKKSVVERQSQTDAMLKTIATLIRKDLGLLINSLLGNISPDQELADEITQFLYTTPYFKPPKPSQRMCEESTKSARQYARHGHVASWRGLDTLLTNISGTHMTTKHHLIHLNHMMSAISAAKAASEMLDGWDLSHEDELPMVNRLIFCRHHVDLAIAFLREKNQTSSQ